jgi:hypothetical protein
MSVNRITGEGTFAAAFLKIFTLWRLKDGSLLQTIASGLGINVPNLTYPYAN